MSGTLERLALQVQVPGFAGTTLPPDVRALLGEGLGGICLFGGNAADGSDALAALVGTVLASREGAVVAIDEEGGDVTRLHAATGSPVLGHAALGAVDDPDLTRRTATAIGAELRALGVNLDLAPVADVNSNSANPVIGVRSFGDDPTLVARHVTAYVEGLRAVGVAACAKHFPGHGDTVADSHVGLPTVEASAEVLRARELVPFGAAVTAAVAAVMTSHVRVPALDPVLPATLSGTVLHVLREELGFDGAVVSDALDMAGASAGRGIPAAAVAAVRAGCDLVLLGPDKDAPLVREVQAAVVAAVRTGELPEERLADAASRVTALAAPVEREVKRADPLAPPEEMILEPAQLAGAREALGVDGELPDLTGARLLRVDTAPTIAVGPVPWGLPAESVREGRGGGRPVVLQVREIQRHPEVQDLVAGLGGDVVVVEYGWPGAWADLPRNVVARVRAYGASRPSVAAVEVLLRERGWRP